jgi:hypothetical protein
MNSQAKTQVVVELLRAAQCAMHAAELVYSDEQHPLRAHVAASVLDVAEEIVSTVSVVLGPVRYLGADASEAFADAKVASAPECDMTPGIDAYVTNTGFNMNARAPLHVAEKKPLTNAEMLIRSLVSRATDEWVRASGILTLSAWRGALSVCAASGLDTPESRAVKWDDIARGLVNGVQLNNFRPGLWSDEGTQDATTEKGEEVSYGAACDWGALCGYVAQLKP